MAIVLPLVIVSACCAPRKPPTKEIYRGPTESIQDVLAQVNYNNRRLAQMWARGTFRSWFPDEKKRTQYVDGDLTLQYRKPQDLRLQATKFGVGLVMDLGSNDRNYWCLVKPEVDTIWFGDYTRPLASSKQDIPIRPDLILEVLGVSEINENLLAQPMPVMKFDGEHDVYAVTWNVRLPDRLAAEKEVWYDRRSKLPVRVLLYDDNGRVVLRAVLSDHQRVRTRGVDQAQWPRVATAYDLEFPDSGARMVLRLDETIDSHNGFPKDLSFRMPPPRLAAARMIDLNAGEEQSQPQQPRAPQSRGDQHQPVVATNPPSHDISAGRS